MEGDLTFLPGEVQKTVPVKLLEWSEDDSLLGEKQVKQFVMDLTNPRLGAKLGRYPRTTVTIMDSSGKTLRHYDHYHPKKDTHFTDVHLIWNIGFHEDQPFV